MKLHWQILVALVLAVIAGHLTGMDTSLFGLRFYDIYVFLGKLFLNALKMLIVPLILSSIITGVAGVGESGAMGIVATGHIGRALCDDGCDDDEARALGLRPGRLQRLPGLLQGGGQFFVNPDKGL